jgi:hypothetical protein
MGLRRTIIIFLGCTTSLEREGEGEEKNKGFVDDESWCFNRMFSLHLIWCDNPNCPAPYRSYHHYNNVVWGTLLRLKV